MEQERYFETQQQILLMARVVLDMPLSEFIEAAGRADAIGPILDPTLWHKGNKNLTSFMMLANGLLSFQVVAQSERALIGALAARLASATKDMPTTSTDEEEMEDAGLEHAIREGQQTLEVSIDEVYAILDVGLSERETEALRLAATGKRNKEIARELGLAEQTVRHTMSAIYKKIGTANRAEAVLWAVKRGMVEV